MNTDVIDVEVVEEHHGAIVPAGHSSLIALTAPVAQIVKAQADYQEVCRALLDGNDIQVIGQKEFKKKSAWRKLGVAFGVSTELMRTTHERNERGRIIRTECVVRATAPNGRVSDGIGACDLYERCCEPETCKTPTTWPDGNFRHAHCSEWPCKTAHFSNPQHDIPATAMTRASNRASADLFGMGEVSAEEMRDTGESATTSTWRPSTPRSTRATGGSSKTASEAQQKFVGSLLGRTGMELLDLTEVIGREVVSAPYLTAAEAKKAIDHLQAVEKGEAPRPPQGTYSGPGAPEATAPVDPNAASQAQLGKIAALFGEKGFIDDKAVRHAYVVEIVGREFASTKELSKREASKAIDALTAEAAAADPGDGVPIPEDDGRKF